MCIRDRTNTPGSGATAQTQCLGAKINPRTAKDGRLTAFSLLKGCLLYTSDAADERSSVDLGGRRIIKKKKQEKPRERTPIDTKHETDERQLG